jgi:transposase
MKLYIINLTEEERKELTRLTTGGRHAARKILHARILLQADRGLTDKEISEHLNVSVRTVERVRQRCTLDGLGAALNPKKCEPREPKVDGETEARMIQLACSEPPSGRQRWTLRLLADKLVELKVVDSISHEAVRQHLKKRIKTLAHTAVLHSA